jgi:recombination protein RecA
MNNERALLLGMLLGDGCLKTKAYKDSTYYEYVICHSTKQQAYLEYKLNLFHSLVGGKKPNISYENTKLGNSCRFSRCHKDFRFLHKALYSKNNKKFITRQVLDWLNEQSLAIWYMDDGGLKPSFRVDGTISSCQMTLATYCSEDQADIIITWFKDKYQIYVKKLFHKKSQSYYLSFNTTEGRKFESLISPYIIPSMEYKLPSKRITRVPDTLLETSKGDDIV